MSPPDIDDLIGTLECFQDHLGGRNQKIRARREAILAFFHKSVVLGSSQMPSLQLLLANMEASLELFLLALESGSTQEMPADCKNELAACITRLWAVTPYLEQLQTEDFTARVSAVCQQALQSVFDWTVPTRVQAYVFACTCEWMDEGLLGKERCQLMEQVRHCAEELKND